jgi:GAF domain-containing protein
MSTVDSLCHLIFNIYEAFTAAIYVREGGRLRCVSSVTFAGSFDRNRSLSIDESLPGWVIKHKEPLVIPNFDKDEASLGYYGSTEGIKSFMGYPTEGECVIIVDSKRKYMFTEKEKKILGGFGDVVYHELEREKRSQEIEEKVDELDRERRLLSLFRELNQSNITARDILKECAELSGADFCFSAIEKNGKVVVRDVFQASNQGSLGGEHPLGGTIASLDGNCSFPTVAVS